MRVRPERGERYMGRDCGFSNQLHETSCLFSKKVIVDGISSVHFKSFNIYIYTNKGPSNY